LKKQKNAESETYATNKTWFNWLTESLRERKQEKQNLKELRADDWYYQHSWFEKEYFIHKLKRKLMNFIYKLYTSVEDYLLSDFLFEIEFYTPKSVNLDEYNKRNNTKHKGDFKCYLPIIIKAKEITEAESISIAIRKELETEYGAQMTSFYVLDKIATQERFKNLQNIFESKFKGLKDNIGFIDINTFTPKRKDSNGNDFSLREDRKYFRVLKSGPMPFQNQNFEYLVKYYKTTDEL